jgi:hypothetical protein
MEYHMEDKMSIVRELQNQRTDVVNKLKRIEEKKSTVSVEVYDKVKKEYADKLKGIEDQLGGHMDVITDEVQRLKTHEDELLEKDKDTKFKMEELELRYSIGEYDEESFKKAKEEHDAAVQQMNEELEKTRENMTYYASFLKPKEGEPAPEPAPEPEPKPAPEPETEPEKPVEKESGLRIDEHILEEKLPEEEVALEELLSEEEAVKPDVAAEGPAKPEAEQDKGVACPKCGHLNTADSWYCEKCGAEILGASGSS